ncbi:MAG: dehydrogenase [Bacilli bacterium]|nr:dehydrogenase [Bacilli bacterium]
MTAEFPVRSGSVKCLKVLFNGPNQTAFDQFDLSTDLSEDGVLVRTQYSLISPGTELAIYTGTHIGIPDPNNTFAKYPFSPGYASVGEVVAVGDAVTELQAGDMVYALGNHASYNVFSWFNRENRPIIKLPQDMAGERAVFARLAAICMTAVVQSRITIGDYVAVLGMGLIGNLAAQLYKSFGACPIGIDLVEKRLQIAKRTGIPFTIHSGERADLQHLIKNIISTSSAAPDLVVEATGVPALVNTALDLVRPMGQVILLGSTRGLVEMDAYKHIHSKGIFLTGAHEKLQGHHGLPSRLTLTRHVLDLIEKGAIVVDPLLTHKLPADKAEEGYQLLLNHKELTMGVLLDWSLE